MRKLFFYFIFLNLSLLHSQDWLELAQHGDLEEIKSLLDLGFNTDLKDGNDMNLLMWAAHKNPDSEVIKEILNSSDLDINDTTETGMTALILSVFNNSGITKILIDSGADINAFSDGGVTVLMWFASKTQNTDVIDYLLDAGADVNATDDNENTVYDYAKHNSFLRRSGYLDKLKPNENKNKANNLENEADADTLIIKNDASDKAIDLSNIEIENEDLSNENLDINQQIDNDDNLEIDNTDLETSKEIKTNEDQELNEEEDVDYIVNKNMTIN